MADNNSDNTSRGRIDRRTLIARASAIGAGLACAPLSRNEPANFPIAAQPATGDYRVYLAPDIHTDYMKAADDAAYQEIILRTLDRRLDRMDATSTASEEHRARWNCDGSLWLRTYEEHRGPTAVARLVERMRDGHLSAPLNPVVCCFGGAPAEVVLRGMYYAGDFERRHAIRLELACANENQTLPLGLASLFAGAGARWTWRGICGCHTKVPTLNDKPYDLYWWEGPDGRRLLMKWHSFLGDDRDSGGYAEARRPEEAVRLVTERGRESGFAVRYPYRVIGLFGQGWEDLEVTDEAVRDAALLLDQEGRKVIVSNQTDFFRDVESTYGDSLPRWGAAFGNEWDVLVASLAEQTARVRRAATGLRTAEALATIACRVAPEFMTGHQPASSKAFMDMGLYFEHGWTANGAVTRARRAEWQRHLADGIETYVNDLRESAMTTVASAVPGGRHGPRFILFNPLGWSRGGVADLPWSVVAARLGIDGDAAVEVARLQVVDVGTGLPLPAQPLRRDGSDWLRVAIAGVPAVGYRVVEVSHGTAPQDLPPAGVVTRGTVVTDAFQMDVDVQGRITRLLDRARGNRELVRPVEGWAMNALAPGAREGAGVLEVESAGSVCVTLRAAGDVPLRHVTRITLYASDPRIDIDNEITEGFGDTYSWRYGFELGPFELRHEEVGAILTARRRDDGGHYAAGAARTDWLSLGHFAAMSDATRTVTLSNADCAFFKVGQSTPDHLDTTTPALAILAGGQIDGPDLGIRNQGGDSHFLQRFAISVSDRYDAAASMQFAMEHQHPLVVALATGDTGPLPMDHFSFLRLDNPSVIPWAIKPAEIDASSEVTLRAWNVAPRRADSSITVTPPWTIRSALETTHLETPLEAMAVDRGLLNVSQDAWAMDTWRIAIGRLNGEGGRVAYLPALDRDG